MRRLILCFYAIMATSVFSLARAYSPFRTLQMRASFFAAGATTSSFTVARDADFSTSAVTSLSSNTWGRSGRRLRCAITKPYSSSRRNMARTALDEVAEDDGEFKRRDASWRNWISRGESFACRQWFRKKITHLRMIIYLTARFFLQRRVRNFLLNQIGTTSM